MSSNWHWVQRDCSKWSHDWVKATLPNVLVSADGVSVKVDEVSNVEGDVTVGRRKSKLITIYDLDISLKWTATTEDGTEITGTVRIPEMSHEAFDGLSDYVFDFSSSASSPAYATVKKALPAALKEKFAEYQAVLLETHGKDLISTDSPAASGATTPAPAAAAAASSSSSSAAASGSASADGKKHINTSRVSVETNLRASASDVWGLLTDERKIPSWSRSAAQFSPTPSSPYSLFSGAVYGEIQSATPPKEIVMTWGLRSIPAWPKDHFATLKISIDQQAESTKVVFTLDGVPKGLEKEIESNLAAFYVKGFAAIGLVTAVPPSSSSKSRSVPARRKKGGRPSKTSPPSGDVNWLGIVAVASLSAGLVALVLGSLR